MPQPPDSDQDNLSKDGLEIDQAVRGDGNQTVGNMSGGTVIGVQNVYIQPTQHTEYGQPVRQGLNALVDLMQASGVKDAVIRFRVVFHAASEQINVVANYKALHDLLHTLEFQCYNVIVRAAKRFPDDDVALDELMEYNLILQNRIEELQQVAARETIAASEVQWLTKLQDAETELQSAIDTLETKPLKRTIRLLNRVLANQPTRINSKLNASAKALRLPDLVDAMQFIAETLRAEQLDGAKLSQFENGVTSLGGLKAQLGTLVDNHDSWQEFDQEMRRIESTLNQDVFELEMCWPDLQSQANDLIISEADSWKAAFQKYSRELDAAIQAENPVKIKRFFRLYRKQTSDRFFQVDVTLKRLCEELREVGEPLDLVLEMME